MQGGSHAICPQMPDKDATGGMHRKRKIALFCTVVSSGPLVIVRMPEHHVRWSTVRREIHAMMRREHGIRAKDIHAVEALAGDVDGDTDGGETAEICRRAFAGDRMTLAAFDLQAWDDGAGGFRRAREAIRDA